jgi:uncharacterized membrane protein YgcG
MRKHILAVAAAAVALIAIGAAPASADVFKGSCHFTGVATFGSNLTGTPSQNTYDFNTGSPDGGKTPDASRCKGKLNGAAVDTPISAFVKGGGTLSCASSNGMGGSGALIFPTGQTFPFKFDFLGATTEVFFTTTDSKGNQTNGHASFQKYAPPDEAAATCGGAGYHQLGFDADAPADGSDGTFDNGLTPSRGSSPSGGGSGSGGGGGGSGSSGSGSSGSSGTSGSSSTGSGTTPQKTKKAKKCKKAKGKHKKKKAKCKPKKKKKGKKK